MTAEHYLSASHSERMGHPATSRAPYVMNGLAWLAVVLILVGSIVGLNVYSGSCREQSRSLRKQIRDLEKRRDELVLKHRFYECQYAALASDAIVARQARKIGLRSARIAERSPMLKIVRTDKTRWETEYAYMDKKQKP